MSEQSLTSEVDLHPSAQHNEEKKATQSVMEPNQNIEKTHGNTTVNPKDSSTNIPAYQTETQFQGLIDLVNAKAEDIKKSVSIPPKALNEENRELLSDDAKEVIENTYKEFNTLIEQQRTLQSQQSVMHHSLLERERTLDKRERQLLERSLEVERELRESERVRHSYEQRLQVVAEKEAVVEHEKQDLDVALKSRVDQQIHDIKQAHIQKGKDLETFYEEEFQKRCSEAELDFEARHKKLEDRFRKKKKDLNEKVKRKQELLESEIAKKVQLIETALISKLEQQKTQTAHILTQEKSVLQGKEETLQALYQQRLSELEDREREIETLYNNSHQELIRAEEIQASFDAERASLNKERQELAQRSALIKTSSSEFKTLLDEAKIAKESQTQLQNELQENLSLVQQERTELQQQLIETKADQAEVAVQKKQLDEQESDIEDRVLKSQEDLQEAKSARERAVKLEEEAEARLSKIKRQQADLAEQEKSFATTKQQVTQRDSELGELLEQALENKQKSEQDRIQTELLREDAKRLHEMRSNALAEAEADKDKCKAEADKVTEELKELKERRTLLEKKLKELDVERTELSLGREALAQEQQELDQEYKEAMTAVRQQSISVDEMRERLEEREQRIQKREQSLDLRDQKLIDAEHEFSVRDKGLIEKEDNLAQRDQASIQREKENTEYAHELNNKEKKLNAKQATIEELVAQVQQERSSLEMDIAALEIEKAGLSGLSERAKELDERVRQIELRRADVESKARELKRADKRLSEEKVQTQSRLKEAKEIQHQTKSLEQDLVNREQILKHAQQELNQQRESIQGERASINQKRRDLEVDQALFETKQSELETLKKKIENDRYEIDALQREIEESHVLNLKLIEERARLEEGLSRVKDREEELHQRDLLLTQKEENMWQLESDVTESLEEAKERDRWAQDRLAEVEAREQEMKQINERYQAELKLLKERYNQVVLSEERMQSQVNSIETASKVLQQELEAARERFDLAEDDNRDLMKRNTQLEIEIKSKSALAQKAEDALRRVKTELTSQQEYHSNIDQTAQAKNDAEKLRQEAQELLEDLTQRESNLSSKEKTLQKDQQDVKRLRKHLESLELEMKSSVEDVLKEAEEEREIAQMERKAAEADRAAAKADRQVAQRERLASTRKSSGSYSTDLLKDKLNVDTATASNSKPDDPEKTKVPQNIQEIDEPIPENITNDANFQFDENLLNAVSPDKNVDVARSNPTPSLEIAKAGQALSQSVSSPEATRVSREVAHQPLPERNLKIPRRGPRDPRGGTQQMARFGALEIPLRRCPEGIGRIGSEQHEGRAEEKPLHQAKFSSAFWLSETPVTQLQWMAVMRQNPSQFTDPYRPVDGVSWIDAARFCNRLSTVYDFTPAYEITEGPDAPMVYWHEQVNGFRLPTEAEWEYAARANSSEKNELFTSSNLEKSGWYRENSQGETRPVGLKAPNDWGFVDFCGNVWEWCHDEWTRSAYQERSNMPLDEQSKGRQVTQIAWNPVIYRPDMRHKVARGGSFADSDSNCRIACRGRLEVFGRRYSVGLRICLPHDTTL